MAQGVCVITEYRNGAFRRVSFEAASAGRRLADALGEPLTAVTLGEGVAAAAPDLGQLVLLPRSTALYLRNCAHDANGNMITRVEGG